ncbi:hypothetical protein [Actinacidiphila acididurans]|uniref:Integral membrane protein n=1 Tax=Actinacidiphila acididurans TaxID=2784346 RepID=A0ABS2TU67_9ACTN|nr:hypothetical protein [Actinacidiphila acididurans]MBM9506377.1 hypothetical protein [Actinacidiphila acididurans]
MTVSERSDDAVATAVRRARTARTARRVLAVPFWSLLALCVVAWPLADVASPGGAWNAVRVLATILLVPVAVARAVPTTRFLRLRDRDGAARRGAGCVVAVGLFLGTFVLTGAALVLGPELTPTVAVTATVAECHNGLGRGSTRECTGNWIADGTTVSGRTLPVAGTPGGTVRIMVRRDDAYSAFAPLTGNRRALGAGLGAAGVVLLGTALYALATRTRQVRRQIDDALAAVTP